MVTLAHACCRTGAAVNMKAGRDVYYDEIAKGVPADCPCAKDLWNTMPC